MISDAEDIDESVNYTDTKLKQWIKTENIDKLNNIIESNSNTTNCMWIMCRLVENASINFLQKILEQTKIIEYGGSWTSTYNDHDVLYICAKNNCDMIRLLLEYEFPVNINSVVYIYIERFCSDELIYTLVDQCNDHPGLLTKCAFESYYNPECFSLIDLLLDRYITKIPFKAITYAIEYHDTLLLNKFMDYGADIYENNDELLYYAFRYYDMKIINLLINAGANIQNALSHNRQNDSINNIVEMCTFLSNEGIPWEKIIPLLIK